MTDGRDESDDRSTDAGPDDRRDTDRTSEWKRPWPGETRSEPHQDRQRATRDGVNSPTENRGRPSERNTGRPPARTERTRGTESSRQGDQRETERRHSSHSRQPRRQSDSRESPTRVAEREVYIDDDVHGDDAWIDLGERRPDGEALAAGDLTETELREYTTDRRSLHPLVQVNWGVRVTIGAVLVGLIISWGLSTLGVNPLYGAAIVGLFVLLGLTWVVLYYRLWVYQVRADAIYLERGVFTHVRSLVPYVRIQHVDTSRSPTERMLGLSTLVVYTAGSRGADVSIPGLLPDEARDLQRRVKELAIEAEGDDAL